MLRKNILIILILLLASFLRLTQIDSNPKAMYGDSLTLVYDAYSILKTGHDQKGNFMPLFFELGGSRPGGYVYATVPFVAIFGPVAVAARAVSVLSGIGIVFLLFLLGRMLISEKAGLAIAILAAIAPWELNLSRGPFESHFALFLSLLGFYGFLRGLKNPKWFLLFGISLALSIQTYSTFAFTLPLFTILLLLWNKNYKLLKSFNPFLIFSILIISSSLLLYAYLSFSRGSENRFTIINIFQDPTTRQLVSEKAKSDRSFEAIPPALSNTLHTPHIEILALWADNYVRNFFPNFLFIRGDGQPRHNPAEMGGFFWVYAFFLLLGAAWLFRQNKKLFFMLLGWSLISPIPTSIIGPPHTLRSSFLLPPLLIVMGVGFLKFLETRKKISTLFGVFLLILFSIQFVYFIDRFYFIAPQKNANFWSYSAKRASLLALDNSKNFDYIILSNDIDNMEFAYPVYAKLDPNLVISANKNPKKIGEFNFFNYGNVYIGSLPHSVINSFIEKLPGTVLYIGSDKEEANIKNNTILRGFDKNVELVITTKPVNLHF